MLSGIGPRCKGRFSTPGKSALFRKGEIVANNIFPMYFTMRLYPRYDSNPNSMILIMRFPIYNTAAGKTGLINFQLPTVGSNVPVTIVPKATIYSGDVTLDDFYCRYSIVNNFLTYEIIASNLDWQAYYYPDDYSIFAYCNFFLGGASAGDWANQAYLAYLDSYPARLFDFQLLPNVSNIPPAPNTYWTGPGNIFSAQFNPSKMLTFDTPGPLPTPFQGIYRYRIPLECSDYCIKMFQQPTKQLLRER